MGMKMYLLQIFFPVSFGFKEIQVKYRYHTNKNISVANLLRVPFGFEEIKVKYRFHKNDNIFTTNLLSFL